MYAVNEPFADSFSEDFVECGLSIHVDGEASGVTSIRQGKGKDASAFFVHQRSSFVATYMNVDNGKYLTLSGHENLIETKATRVEGSVFEFVTQVTGAPFVVTDMDGRVVLRDRGRIAFRYLFDTLGDEVPGGVFVADLDVSVSGPHPSVEGPAFCDAVVNNIG